MWFPDRAELLSADEGASFTLLAWHELFDESTPDSFRPRLYDCISFLEELRIISDEAKKDARWKAYLPIVMAEAIEFLSCSSVVLDNYPHTLHALNANSKSVDPDKVKSLANVLLDKMSDYNEILEHSVREKSRNLPKSKAKMLDALGHLATRACADGVHGVQCKALNFRALLSENVDAAVDSILKVSSAKTSEWECFIGLNAEHDEHRSVITKSAFTALPKSKKPLGEVGDEFLKLTEGCLRAYTVVSAKGASGAVATAAEPIQQLIDFSNFAYNYNAIKLSDWILAQCGRIQILVNIRQSSIYKVQPRRQPGRLPVDILSQLPISRFPDQLLRALEQYTIAQTSADPKVRFVNLWVALETLVGRGGDSIADHAIDAVSPILAFGRTRELLKYLAISLRGIELLEHSPASKEYFPLSTTEKIRRDELLLVLCGKRGIAAQKHLCRAVAHHRLILYRLFELHKTLSDSKSFHQSIISSKNRCEWQLRRIYRERNLLIHSGRCSQSLSYLHDNLNQYFTTAVWHVVNSIVNTASFSVADSFSKSSIEITHTLDVIQREPAKCCVGHVLNRHSPYESELIF